jgi:hypothetical protein
MKQEIKERVEKSIMRHNRPLCLGHQQQINL